jgi:hypothetical protein
MVEDVPEALERSTTDERTALNRVSFGRLFRVLITKDSPAILNFHG